MVINERTEKCNGCKNNGINMCTKSKKCTNQEFFEALKSAKDRYSNVLRKLGNE